ncbi:MAG TPA: uroporphyrinogen decarboxylase, partial [Rhodanobacteraceae bacterium]|nr:uroporphyrinogen decarboxylase [Rhodanobacteraceae bacterium]
MAQTTLENDLLLRALLREPVERTPVWIMRQAGRYLPEYRTTRARAGSFLDLMRTPELACEVTLQPVARFPLDAAILFSDILTIPAAMGLGLHFVEGEGPAFEQPVRDAAGVARLGLPDPEQDLRYVMDTVRLVRRELAGRVPLIGFAGSPWTIASYMIEGRSSRDFARIKGLLYQEPATLHALLEKLAQAATLYLNAQIAAGAQAVMLFDTWGGALSTETYREFSLRYMQAIISGLTRRHDDRRVPVILFTKGGGGWLEQMAGAGADALGLDWTQDIGEARRRVGDKVALQGNLDPAVLLAAPDIIREQAGRILAGFG